MSLWNRWVQYTYKTASDLAEFDRLVYGTGFIERTWWGFRRIKPWTVMTLRRLERVKK